MGNEELQLPVTQIAGEDDGRRELAQQRGDGAFIDAGEGKALGALAQMQDAIADGGAVIVLQRDVLTPAVEKADLERDVQRLLPRLARRRLLFLLDRQLGGPALR